MSTSEAATAAPPRCVVCGFALETSAEDLQPGQRLRCPSRHCGVVLEVREDGGFEVATLRLARPDTEPAGTQHFSLCVLPFLLEDADRLDPFAAIEQSPRWQRRTFSLASEADIDRTEYFLPYIRRFLFPSLFPHEPPRGNAPPAIDTCRHYRFPLELIDASRPGEIHYRLHCRDDAKGIDQQIAISLDRIELLLFGYCVGFLVLRFRCPEPSATFFDQMRSLNFLRFVVPLHRDFELPQLRTETSAYRMPQLVGWLLDEFRTEPSASPASPQAVPVRQRLPVRLVYDDRMLAYSFSCLDSTTCLDEPSQNENLLRRHAVVRFDLAAGVVGKPRRVETESDNWQRHRWDSYSKDGGGLIVFDTDGFHRSFLGKYWETYYFDIFLLAAMQRVMLLSLFERMADIRSLTGTDDESRRQLRLIRFDLLRFKNQCCFSQITNRELGLALWQRWQQVFETQTLLGEVNEQSEELDNFLETRSRERNERLLRLGGLVTTTAPVLWSLDVIFGERPWLTPLKWSLLALLFVAAGVMALFILRRQRHDA